MVQKKKLSVAGIQAKCQTVIDTHVQDQAAEAEQKFIVKVNDDLGKMQEQLKLAESNISAMLISEEVALEDKVAYLQTLAQKLQKLQGLSQPLLTCQDDRI